MVVSKSIVKHLDGLVNISSSVDPIECLYSFSYFWVWLQNHLSFLNHNKENSVMKKYDYQSNVIIMKLSCKLQIMIMKLSCKLHIYLDLNKFIILANTIINQ